jgi:tetratricopeptide (TPR) repeat protein
LSPNDVSSITGLADSQRLLGDSKAAHQTYLQALEIDPSSFKCWHNLGLNFHLQGQLAEAIECYRKSYELAPNAPEVVQSLALSVHQRGDTIAAIELFSTALSTNPSNVQLHECFNNMLWETEFASRFGDSYVVSIKRLGGSRELALSYASMLYRAGRVEQARAVISGDDLANSRDADVLSLKGQIDAELGYYDSAYETLGFSLEQQFSPDVAAQMAKIDIILARYSQAQSLLTSMFSNSPHCQLTWALQGLVWRFNGDVRYFWLCDYDKFVQSYTLEVPHGYASLNQFLEAIRETLNPMHHNDNEPLQQTLRNGTQTAARLLHSPNPVLRDLKKSLDSIVSRYIEGLPEDMRHPFLGRKTAGFEFSGSWSVNLRANGFHINHVHPEGWVSSSCYITIPRSMSDSDASDASLEGHLTFGDSPLQLGDRERVELSLDPTPGRVVLFPSYFWHGTHPFNGGDSDFRLTAPFDVIPL